MGALLGEGDGDVDGHSRRLRPLLVAASVCAYLPASRGEISASRDDDERRQRVHGAAAKHLIISDSLGAAVQLIAFSNRRP